MRGDVGGTDSWTGKSRRAYKSMRVRRSRRVAPAPSGASEAIGSYLNEYACPITAETMTDPLCMADGVASERKTISGSIYSIFF